MKNLDAYVSLAKGINAHTLSKQKGALAMKCGSLWPYEIVVQRSGGMRLLHERFAVVRMRGGVTPDGDFYWSFDNLEDAKDLCHFLVTESLGVYVFDTVMKRKVFELDALPC